MKTFDEALEAVVRVAPFPGPPPKPEDIARVNQLQAEFLPEVLGSGTFQAMLTAFVQGFIGLALREHPDGQFPADKLAGNAFVNGIAVGVAVGIQMERQTELGESGQSSGGQQRQPACEVVGSPIGRISRIRGVAYGLGIAWRAAVRRP